jgi:hypothetical protein
LRAKAKQSLWLFVFEKGRGTRKKMSQAQTTVTTNQNQFPLPSLIEDKDAPFSRTTRWRLRERGLLPFLQIGRRIYYKPEHFEKLFKSCESSAQMN